MLQREIYFFGKLSQSRDFIVSGNLQEDDKHFWDSWFGRCTSQHKLIPFIRKAIVSPKIWLFCVKLHNEGVYIGLAASSSDQTGREYPFVLFCKSSAHSDWCETMGFFGERVEFFRQTLQDGKCILAHCTANPCVETVLSEPVQRYLLTSGFNEDGSFWLESESGRYIEHDGLPSCSLYNKLFGS